MAQELLDHEQGRVVYCHVGADGVADGVRGDGLGYAGFAPGAKVQTLGARVVDSFFVRGADGRKVTDPALLAETERALLHALAAPA